MLPNSSWRKRALSSPYLAASSSYDCVMPACWPDGLGRILFQPLAALDPAGGLEVDARIGAEVVEVSLLAAEEEGDAIVAAGDDQRDAAGGQADHAVAAQGVAEQHGVVLRLVHGGQRFGQPRRHARLADVVQALGKEFQVDAVGRAGHGRAQLAEEDFAGNQFQSQVAALRSPLRRRPRSGSRRRGW